MHQALIIGGGLAGSSLAIRLARAGRETVLLEKEAHPHHKVCGEFLSGEGVSYLNELGIDLPALGAVPIDEIRLAGDTLLGSAALPFRAYSYSRFELDELLLERAIAAGACVLRGQAVESLTRDGLEWHAQTRNDLHRGQEVFLASGKHDMRGWPRPEGRQPNLIGFKMHWQVSPQTAAALERAIELILFPGGYCGLQLVGERIANLGLLVHRSHYKAAGGDWPSLLRHMTKHSRHFERRLSDAAPLRAAPVAISSIPYGHLHRGDDGPWRMGDQAAVIPSFAGSGMSIALYSSALAASTFLSGGSAGTYHCRLAAKLRSRIYLATLLSKALVSRRFEPVVKRGVQVLPGILSFAAARTRVPQC